MNRIDGYINLDEILKNKNVDITSVDTIIQSPLVKIAPNSNYILLIELDNELYYFKYKKFISPYNELVINELAKDFGISTVDYDLAILNGKKGVLSKHFRKEDATYITGEKLLNDIDCDAFGTANNLETIWYALEHRYKDHFNKEKVVENLMNKIVNMFIFDIIVGQTDRHALNWEIEECENNIDIAPIYDNEQIFINWQGNTYLTLLVDEDSSYSSIKNLETFKNISSDEYCDFIKNKLWIISDKNLESIFEKIKSKTGHPMPQEMKDYYLKEYQEHRKKLEKVLNDENIRKR